MPFPESDQTDVPYDPECLTTHQIMSLQKSVDAQAQRFGELENFPHGYWTISTKPNSYKLFGEKTETYKATPTHEFDYNDYISIPHPGSILPTTMTLYVAGPRSEFPFKLDASNTYRIQPFVGCEFRCNWTEYGKPSHLGPQKVVALDSDAKITPVPHYLFQCYTTDGRPLDQATTDSVLTAAKKLVDKYSSCIKTDYPLFLSNIGKDGWKTVGEILAKASRDTQAYADSLIEAATASRFA
jgi:hypothetical protein